MIIESSSADPIGDRVAFNVFLSHNSKDKAMVRELASALKVRGLSVWLDENELRPGVPWQQLLEKGIRSSESVAVLIGKAGIGPWEDEEMRAALDQKLQTQFGELVSWITKYSAPIGLASASQTSLRSIPRAAT